MSSKPPFPDLPYPDKADPSCCRKCGRLLDFCDCVETVAAASGRKERFTTGPWTRSGVRTEVSVKGLRNPIKAHAIDAPGFGGVAYVPYFDRTEADHVETLHNAFLVGAALAMYEALKRAEQFIANGIEMGYVLMPDDPADKANDTLRAIRDALDLARHGRTG